MPEQLAEGQVQVTEELVLLLLPVGQAVQAAAGVGQDALPAQGPQGLVHEGEVVHEELGAVHRHAGDAVLPAEVGDGELPPRALVPVKGEDVPPVAVGDVDGVQDLPVGDEGRR